MEKNNILRIVCFIIPTIIIWFPLLLSINKSKNDDNVQIVHTMRIYESELGKILVKVRLTIYFGIMLIIFYINYMLSNLLSSFFGQVMITYLVTLASFTTLFHINNKYESVICDLLKVNKGKMSAPHNDRKIKEENNKINEKNVCVLLSVMFLILIYIIDILQHLGSSQMMEYLSSDGTKIFTALTLFLGWYFPMESLLNKGFCKAFFEMLEHFIINKKTCIKMAVVLFLTLLMAFCPVINKIFNFISIGFLINGAILLFLMLIYNVNGKNRADD